MPGEPLSAISCRNPVCTRLGAFSCPFSIFRISSWLGQLQKGVLQHPMAKVYSYFESRGCDREGWHEICFFGWELGRLFGGCLLVLWFNWKVRSSNSIKECSGLFGVEAKSQGLQYFLKRYLSGPVVLTLVDFCTSRVSRGRMTVSDIGLRLRRSAFVP